MHLLEKTKNQVKTRVGKTNQFSLLLISIPPLAVGLFTASNPPGSNHYSTRHHQRVIGYFILAKLLADAVLNRTVA